MKKNLIPRIAYSLVAIAVLLSPLHASARLLEAPADEAGVRQALEHYLLGHARNDPSEFRKAMHSDFRMMLMRKGEFVQVTGEQYLAGVKGPPAADEDKRKRSITMVSVTGTTAVAKVVLDYPDVLLTDYMSLLRTGDGWKIVNKLVNVEPKSKP